MTLEDESGTHTVVSDLALSLVMVLILVLVAVYLEAWKDIQVRRRLETLQATVASELQNAAGARHVEVALDRDDPDRQRLRFSGDLLFEVCRDQLKSEGRALLTDIGRVLTAHQHAFEAVAIEGHTDVTPTGGPGCQYNTNWELSSARATTVVQLLTRAGALPGGQVSAIGRAEFAPVDPNDLPLNRRIEIVLQYDRTALERADGS
jgi:flagellar motor protein MotB